MTLKNKLIVSALSMLSLGVGSLYMHDVMEEERLRRADYFAHGFSLAEPMVIASVDLSGLNSGGRSRRSNRRTEQNPYPNPARVNKALGGVDRTQSVLSMPMTGIARRMNSETRNEAASSPAIGVMMAAGGRSSGSSLGDRHSGVYASASLGGIGGGTNIITPFGAPQNPSGYVFVDPMTEEEMNMIPVGEGWWILLLLGVGYIAIKRRMSASAETVC